MHPMIEYELKRGNTYSAMRVCDRLKVAALDNNDYLRWECLHKDAKQIKLVRYYLEEDRHASTRYTARTAMHVHRPSIALAVGRAARAVAQWLRRNRDRIGLTVALVGCLLAIVIMITFPEAS